MRFASRSSIWPAASHTTSARFHNEDATSMPQHAPNQTSTDDGRVRDHLANERTYLAWTRTGVAIMGFGVVIARLRYLFPSNALTPPVRGIVHAADIGL